MPVFMVGFYSFHLQTSEKKYFCPVMLDNELLDKHFKKQISIQQTVFQYVFVIFQLMLLKRQTELVAWVAVAYYSRQSNIYFVIKENCQC